MKVIIFLKEVLKRIFTFSIWFFIFKNRKQKNEIMFDANIETSCNYSLYIIIYVKLVFWYFYKLKFHLNHKMYKEKRKKNPNQILWFIMKNSKENYLKIMHFQILHVFIGAFHIQRANWLRPLKLNLLSSYLLIQ